MDDCLTQKLLSFAGCKADYCQTTHFLTKKFIDDKLHEDNLSFDPCSILEKCFLPDLNSAGVMHSLLNATSTNMSLSLKGCLNPRSLFDFIFIKRPSSIQQFNGSRPHFDLTNNQGKVVRYKLVSFVSKTHYDNIYSTSSRICDLFFTVCNLNICKISEDAFLEMSRSAEYLVFKLDSPLSSDPSFVNPGDLKRKIPLADDPFEFEPSSKPLKKVKVRISSNQRAIPTSYQWLSYSETGRLDLSSDQFTICHSNNLEYDDLIVNSYARMCQVNRRNSFLYQNSCLSSPYCNNSGGFKAVDQKFIQIINT